jgi:hypothetical protein
MILKVILLTISMMALAFAGLGIKILAKKDGEFAGTCASKNPYLKKQGVDCGCGNEDACEN